MLIPTFRKLYPNKKMILVADNAPYHKCQGAEGTIKVNSTNRPELLEWIEEKCDEVDIGELE